MLKRLQFYTVILLLLNPLRRLKSACVEAQYKNCFNSQAQGPEDSVKNSVSVCQTLTPFADPTAAPSAVAIICPNKPGPCDGADVRAAT